MLLAARPVACVPFREAINGHAEVVEADTMHRAIARLKGGSPIHLVCSTLFFDDSRMFDLLRWVRAELPNIPFICARAFSKDMSRISLEAVRIAADSLGAAAFIDLVELGDEHGGDTARERLRQLIFSHIGR